MRFTDAGVKEVMFCISVNNMFSFCIFAGSFL